MLSFDQFLTTLCETADAGLAAKASKSGISIGTLRKVYRRGVAAWNSGHRPGTTPQQWGMARVNSYIGKGSGTYHGADKDLHEEELLEKKLPEVPKDKESGLPKKYVAGLSASTAKARAAHWDKMDKKSDSDPSAYEPAPGDANAKTKPSKHTLKYHAMFGEEMDEELYEACWSTHKQIGMKKKGDRMVPDCVPKNEEIQIDENRAEHARTILHHTKNIRIEGDHPEGHLSGGALHYTLSHLSPTFAKLAVKHHDDFHHMVKHASDEDLKQMHDDFTKKKVNEEVESQFDLIESVINELALIHNLDPEYIWEKFEQFSDEELLEYAVDAKGHKSSTGGLTQKGRDAYNAKGANLQAPVTTPPSKLKAGSKAANRRKSFCARMGGMEGPMKKPNGEPSRKALALRKWNC